MFSTKERNIFKFCYNGKTVLRDPQRLLRRMNATRPQNYDQLTEVCQKANEPNPGPEMVIAAYKAMDVIVPWACSIFGVQLLDDEGNGITEDELMGVMSEFVAFVNKKKENTDSVPNSSPSIQEQIHSSDVVQPMKSTSDCGCGGNSTQ